jgi:hypothetical protein
MTFWRPMVRSLGAPMLDIFVLPSCTTSRMSGKYEEKKASDLRHKNYITKSATAELKKRRQVGYLVSDVTWRGESVLVTQRATCLHYQYIPVLFFSIKKMFRGTLSLTRENHQFKYSCCATPNVHIAKPIGTMSGDVASSQSQQKHSRSAIGWRSV